MAEGLIDMLRSDKPGKNARDGYVTEHAEIAAYSLMEKLAEQLGDHETARIARTIRQDEEQMSQWFTNRWGQFVRQTLASSATPMVQRLLGNAMPSRMSFSSGSSTNGSSSSDMTRTLFWAASLGVLGYLAFTFLTTSPASHRR